MAVPGIGAPLLMVTALVWFALEIGGAGRRRAGATVADGRSLAVLRTTTAAAFVAAILVGHLVPGAAFSSAVGVAVGLLLLWSGIALRWWSRKVLGEYFTYTVQTSADQPVIADGPYRWVRHPAYLGMVLALAGFATVLANWLSLLVFLPIVMTGVVYRIRVEEAALLRDTGPAYADYERGRARLVPRVW